MLVKSQSQIFTQYTGTQYTPYGEHIKTAKDERNTDWDKIFPFLSQTRIEIQNKS